MGNIVDYVAWRGDLSFKVSPFNQIDSIIICQLLYTYLDGIVPENFSTPITLSKVARLYASLSRDKINLGVFLNDQTANLLAEAGKSKRFGPIKLCGFINDIDLAQEKQFAACTAILPTGMTCVVYRGTDDTLIGWKESFNMSFLTPIPSQLQAVEYIEKVNLRWRGKMLVMGHSKGGNLAVYASTFCKPKTASRILEVFNNDGPGFSTAVVANPAFLKVTKKIRTVIPHASLVGVLFKRPYAFTVVESSENYGVAQHNLFSWQIQGTQLITRLERSKESLFSENTVNAWLEAVEYEKQKEFVDALFCALDSTGAKTLSELNSNWIKNSAVVIKNMHGLEKETKEQISGIVKLFFQSIRASIPPIKGQV